jgi:hypothetical protein
MNKHTVLNLLPHEQVYLAEEVDSELTRLRQENERMSTRLQQINIVTAARDATYEGTIAELLSQLSDAQKENERLRGKNEQV